MRSLDYSDAATLRHELRTPLNHVIGYTEMMLEDEGEPNGRAERLEAIRSTARELVSLIQNTIAPDKELVQAGEVKTLRIWLRAPLRQIVQHTTTLASDATDEQAADLAKVRTAAESLLAFAEGRTEQVESPEAAAEPEAQASATEQNRLLVVDDNAGNRDMLSRHLQRQGYATVMAEDGKKALDLLWDEPFDMVLLDIMMPEIDGFAVLREMKASPRLETIPVIMISALDETQSVVRGIEMGAEDYLTKPFDPVVLRARVGASLEKKRLRDLDRQHVEELQKALEELRKTQDQLITQEKLASLGSLTAGIAHEIKNPLNFVTNFAELSIGLLTDLRDALAASDTEEANDILADLEGNLAKIQEHGKRADRIVRGMLMHSRGVPGERQEVDLNALVSDAVSLAYHGFRARDMTFNVKLDVTLDPTLGRVEGVPQDLSRVFLNLVNNACYAVHQKRQTAPPTYVPTVQVRSLNCGEEVEVRVRDNGPGIPEVVREKLFQPFFTTKPAGQGTGLGLSISRDIIVRGHQGDLQVRTQEGEYTEFIVRLPKGAA